MVIAGGQARVAVAGGGAYGGGADADCGGCCFEADPAAVKTEERWVYVGNGAGSYSQVSSMEMVGAGRGEFEKQRYSTVTGWRVSACCVGTTGVLALLAIFLPFGFVNNWWQPARDANPCEAMMLTYRNRLAMAPVAMKATCCAQGFAAFCQQAPVHDKLVVHDKFYTQVKNVHVAHTVPVPIPPPARKVITHHVVVHTHAFDCDAGAGFMDSWPARKQRYCCYLRHMACHTKVTYRPHYHTITHIKHVSVPMPVPIPAPPAQVVNKVVNVPIHDAPQVIKVPVPGQPHVVPKYVHEKHYVPVPEPSPPTYHTVPVPVKVTDPGQVIHVPSPLPAQTVVRNKVIYKTRHVKVQHVFDCHQGFANWNSGWSSAKKSWCCAHQQMGCPGDHSGQLTKSYVTHVTQHVGPTYTTHHQYSAEEPIHVVHHYGAYGGTVGHYGEGSVGSFSSFAGSHGARRLQEDFTGEPFEADIGGQVFDANAVGGKRLDLWGEPIQGLEGEFIQDGAGSDDLVSHDGGFENSWHDGHFGHYDHAGTWTSAHFPHDAWYGDHYGHYDEAGTFFPMTYPHDAWIGGHFGHYDQQGTWVAAHTTHYHEVDGGRYVHHIVTGAPKHTMEKNYYHVRTKTHVVHDPVHIPGRIIHKQVTLPARPVYDCDNGYQAWKTLWTPDQQKYCCYKYSRACTSKIIKHLRYHTVVDMHNVPVPVPKPIPVQMPPPPPQVIHVPVHLPPPPREVEKVPVPVPLPSPDPEVITKVKYFKKPMPVPVVVHKTQRIPVPVQRIHYVRVPVPEPSPPHIIYHTEKVVSHAFDCDNGLSDWQETWSNSKRLYCCWRRSIGCPHSRTVYHTKTIYHNKVVHQKVHLPQKIIYKDVTVHHAIDIDCNSGYHNWYYGWSNYKKHYCCTHEKRGCPGTWHGFIHAQGEFHGAAHVGQATGHIYDCEAGFDNWLHGWSDSKKQWCCSKESKGCVKFHGCAKMDVGTWSSEKRDWCCGNFQKGCAHTTLSPLGCKTPCHLHGEASTCEERIKWASEHVFGSRDNACSLAYSQIQVECDVCRSCTIGAAGCEVVTVAGKDAYDCDAALNNFFRAWSPAKKQWCCKERLKGCEGNTKPSVDPGAGMMWKHVQVNGYWTWQVVAGAGGAAAVPASLPYDCNVGQVNWKIGWSAPKKSWCCAHNHVGCPGSSGGITSHATHVTVHYTHGGTVGAAAAAGGSWHHSGSWHHNVHVVHHVHHLTHARRLEGFDCAAGRASFASWTQEKKDYCCAQNSVLCEDQAALE